MTHIKLFKKVGAFAENKDLARGIMKLYPPWRTAKILF
jgi:hypothetical protein